MCVCGVLCELSESFAARESLSLSLLLLVVLLSVSFPYTLPLLAPNIVLYERDLLTAMNEEDRLVGALLD